MHKDELMAAQQAPATAEGKLYNLTILHIKPDPNQPHKHIYPQGVPRGILQAVVGKSMPNVSSFDMATYCRNRPFDHLTALEVVRRISHRWAIETQ